MADIASSPSMQALAITKGWDLLQDSHPFQPSRRIDRQRSLLDADDAYSKRSSGRTHLPTKSCERVETVEMVGAPDCRPP